MDNEVSEVNISKLNSGGLINLRLHNLWVDRHKYALRGDYSKWNEILDSIWCELGADAKENDGNDKDFWKLTKEFGEASKDIVKKGGFKPIDNKDSLIKQKIALIKKELFLRRLQNKQGKGTAYLDEDDFE